VSVRRLLAVHAHPDDECISTGGILARYAAEGARVCLVTCTNGEEGEVAPEAGDPEALRRRLAEVRLAELRQACRELGVSDLRLLGYRDSGMEGAPANAHPEAFVNQPLEEVVPRLVAVIREVRPQVLVTYNELGFYGHPDHVQAHRVALAAVREAADPRAWPGAGEPWRVQKVYYTAVPKSRLRAARDVLGDPVREGEPVSEEEVERIGTDDELVTTAVDVSAYVEAKVRALRAHVTQLGTTSWFLSLPDQVRQAVLGVEHFVLATAQAPRPEGLETDLFWGLGP
jgi:N-acetyl-1-D-myo-inositol-2-amino-2-deoxy-alpha-D-glucopyranoside deacetylase